MAKLTDEQEKALDDLLALKDAPDDPGPSRGENLNITIDLGNDVAVRRALKLGVLTRGELDEFDDAPDDDDADADDADDDPQPRRRLTGADRLMGGDAK